MSAIYISSRRQIMKRRMRRLGVAAAIFFAALVMGAPRGTAAASPGYDLFAVVATDGTLARGTPGTTVSHVGTGLYDVTFPQAVEGCAAVGNLGYIGNVEDFTFQSIVTTSTDAGGAVHVDVIYPGDTTAGNYPHTPVLADNSFHLHVDCHHALFANVKADGTLACASKGVRSSHLGTGSYQLSFASKYLQGCAPVATVRNPLSRRAFPVQAFLSLGADLTSLQVSVNVATTRAIDAPFSVIVTCTESPTGFFPNGDGFDTATIPKADKCALTSSWMNYTVGGAPSDQGYVSTWATSSDTGFVLTKNGGYGVNAASADIVATCPVE
jgi:hypothetical protein